MNNLTNRKKVYWKGVGSLNIFKKVSIYLKLIYKVNAVPIMISARF